MGVNDPNQLRARIINFQSIDECGLDFLFFTIMEELFVTPEL